MLYDSPDFLLSESEREYLLSDYLSAYEQEIEAEVPVPDRLLPKSKYRDIVRRLKLSQMIGILLWLNRSKALTIGGRQRLLYLQERASFEAISAGLKFAERLSKSWKLQSDFKHAARELNRRPQSKRFRLREKRRIGVGYRDKGTLPDPQARARRKSQEEGFIFLHDLTEEVQDFIKTWIPTAVEGDWVDLRFIQDSDPGLKRDLTQLVRPL